MSAEPAVFMTPDPDAAAAVAAFEAEASSAVPSAAARVDPFWGQTPAEPLVPHWLLVRMAWHAREDVLWSADRETAPWPGERDREAVALSMLVQRILAAPKADAFAIGAYWRVVEREYLGIDGALFHERPRVDQLWIFAVRGLALGLSTDDAALVLATT